MSPEATPAGELRLGSGQMFDRIAGRYDFLNRILSLGIDQSWRRRTVASLQLAPGARVLDLATGTADLAIQIARREAKITVVGVDPSARMLEVGRAKLAKQQLAPRVTLELGDAQALPFPAASFDAAAMAFGIRNVPDRPLGLRELARVVRPGGRIAILELCEPRRGPLGALARLYVHQLVPRIGALLSGQKEYRYLQASIARFPPPEAFAEVMRQNGLVDVEARSLTFGACALFTAQVA